MQIKEERRAQAIEELTKGFKVNRTLMKLFFKQCKEKSYQIFKTAQPSSTYKHYG